MKKNTGRRWDGWMMRRAGRDETGTHTLTHSLAHRKGGDREKKKRAGWARLGVSIRLVNETQGGPVSGRAGTISKAKASRGWVGERAGARDENE